MLLKALGASAAEAGYYGAAHNLALAPIVIAAAAAGPLLAALTRAHLTGEHEQARRVTGVVVRVLLASLPFAALISGSADAIVSLIYGARFAEAAAPLAILIFSSAGMVAVSVGAASIIAAGRPRLTLVPVLPVVPAAVLGYLAFVPSHGPTGAATVTSVAALAAGLIGLTVTLRCWNLSLPLFTLLRSVVLGALLFWVSDNWSLDGPWVIAKLIALGASVPIGFALLGEFSSRDRRDLQGLYQRFTPRSAQG
jgi:O-antigen/teichoic acid export membrane protein